MLDFEGFLSSVGLEEGSLPAHFRLNFMELDLATYRLLDPKYASNYPDQDISVQSVAQQFNSFTHDVLSCVSDDASAPQYLNAFDAAMAEVRSTIALAYFREEVGRFIESLPEAHTKRAFLRPADYQGRARSSCLLGLEGSVSLTPDICLMKIQAVLNDYNDTLQAYSWRHGEQAALLVFLSEVISPDIQAENVDVSSNVNAHVENAIGRLNMDLIEQKYSMELIAAAQAQVTP